MMLYYINIVEGLMLFGVHWLSVFMDSQSSYPI